MGSYRITLLPGDGIGPEVMAQTRLVLESVVEGTDGLSLEMTEQEGGAGHFRKTGVTLPEETLAAIRGIEGNRG